MKKRHFRVTLEMPEDVTTTYMREYIKEAVQTWKGQLPPEDPLFDLDGGTVRVATLVEKWEE